MGRPACLKTCHVTVLERGRQVNQCAAWRHQQPVPLLQDDEAHTLGRRPPGRALLRKSNLFVRRHVKNKGSELDTFDTDDKGTVEAVAMWTGSVIVSSALTDL